MGPGSRSTEAFPKFQIRLYLKELYLLTYDCYAADRGQARSYSDRAKQTAGFV
jgi:hypothetical protein